MSDQREQAQAQFRTANLWNFMNTMKRNADVERATVAKANGINPAELQGFLAEIPFGNQTIVSQSAESKAPSAFGNFTKAAVLALAAGAIGFGANHLLQTPKPVTPPPVNAVLEWEITPDGERAGTGVFTEIRSDESRVLGEASGVTESND